MRVSAAAWCAERKRLELSEQVFTFPKRNKKSFEFFILSQRSICLYRSAIA
jgi:hypothetical protein